MNHETFQDCSAAAVRRLVASLTFSTIMLIIFLKGMENVRNHFYSQKTELSIHLCLSFFSGIQIWHCIFSWYIRIWIKFHCIYLLLVCSYTLFLLLFICALFFSVSDCFFIVARRQKSMNFAAIMESIVCVPPSPNLSHL